MFYKVVRKADGKLIGACSTPFTAVNYEVGKYTKCPNGQRLFVFDDAKYAYRLFYELSEKRTAHCYRATTNYPDTKICVYECKVKNPKRILNTDNEMRIMHQTVRVIRNETGLTDRQATILADNCIWAGANIVDYFPVSEEDNDNSVVVDSVKLTKLVRES